MREDGELGMLARDEELVETELYQFRIHFDLHELEEFDCMDVMHDLLRRPFPTTIRTQLLYLLGNISMMILLHLYCDNDDGLS